ncbi:MAG: hypothetical protein ABIK39_06875 [candidate division WOR-3 bacterium]
MAKIPTGRIVLYVILAIIVIVVAVWVIRTRQQEAKRGKRVVEVEDIPRFVRNVTKQIESEQRKLGGLSGAEIDQANQLLQEARQGLEEIQSLTDQEEITQKRDEIMEKIAEARKLRKKVERGQ